MKVKNLSKTIRQQQILNNISFEVSPGTITGIIGRNGAGKTTLLRTMAGILLPSSGDVFIGNHSILKHPAKKQTMIFIPDNLDSLKTYSTNELITLYKMVYPGFDMDYFNHMRAHFSLPDVNRISQLSKGMKALFVLILAFSSRVDYLLLDEPTDGLDAIVKRKVLDFLVEQARANQVAVMIASHRLEELDFMVDDVLILRNGEVEEHFAIGELKTRYRKLQLAFQSGSFPPDLLKRVTPVSQSGSVYAVLISAADSAIYNEIQDHDPVLFEELKLTLEDVFLARLGGTDDVL
ncbi:ATP-binding cassette domain-containing protein [Salisediminibacterium beveridgei]|uniref:ABC transporter, ATP-binding protein n=1 Tax=Salisediminibacterium beveridgei TaxID=632773 RepID=A0A1D7QTW9_9BACI|nr:ABC transporter ATP-binding protein [Salisediminibacterium beveridgei]AOM82437.1 ABC transporter, ATP-binding protein [Salisediminibacterium beveridgei]